LARPRGIGEDNSAPRIDEDGFIIGGHGGYFSALTISKYQVECWNKFVKNPLANTSVRDTVGRLCGKGFDISSDIRQISDVVYEIWTDWRNRLYSFFPKFVARAEVEGELFLLLTVHTNGFVEVDFMDPGLVRGEGTDGTGIYFHPKKATLPVAYSFETKNEQGFDVREVIPSIFVAYSPDLIRSVNIVNKDYLKSSQNSNKAFKSLGGFFRFVVEWDKGYITRRNVSHLLTTIEWINHYENLKKYEIDHKKSAGSYLWVAEMNDPKAFRTWLSLTDTQRAETGLAAKKTPGGTLILPPGITLKCMTPNLTKISEQDNDILEMVIAGLNKPSDQITGSTKGTFASAKALKAPQSDRISDEISYFERFLRYDFWKPIFFLRSAVNPSFKLNYLVEEVVSFDDETEPVLKKVRKNAWDLIEVNFPVSEMADIESQARALLGVKHGSVTDVLGIPRSVVAKKLGLSGSYKFYRLQHATEDKMFPKLIQAVDAESYQEQTEAEPKRGGFGGEEEEKGKDKEDKEDKGKEDKTKEQSSLKPPRRLRK
jgi:hypothetical protein